MRGSGNELARKKLHSLLQILPNFLPMPFIESLPLQHKGCSDAWRLFSGTCW